MTQKRREAFHCATCPLSSGCWWECLRGDDLAEIAELKARIKEQPFRIACSGNRSVDVVVGTRFSHDGCVWEIVTIPRGPLSYSPDVIGGTPTIRCQLISGEPDGRFTPHMENGEVDWCADSIAANIVTPGYAFDRVRTVMRDLAEAQSVLSALTEAADIAYQHGDFRNGVTDSTGTIDEGDVRVAGPLGDALRRAKALLAKGS